jgi:hypothetical protein
MDAELEEHRRRVIDVQVRLAGYEPRLGGAFLLQGELDGKLARLADIEADLAGTEGSVTANHPQPRAAAA